MVFFEEAYSTPIFHATGASISGALARFARIRQIGKLSDITIPFLGRELSPPFCKDLAVIFDRNLFFDFHHVNHLSSSLLGKLCQINSVRHLRVFSKDVLWVILYSLVFSKLFYCSTVWSGTTQQNIQKLQLLQRFAARILSGEKNMITFPQSLENLDGFQ